MKTTNLHYSLVALLTLLLGLGIWLPQIIGSDNYPLDYHRVLVINGFVIFSIMGLARIKLSRLTGPLFFLATITAFVSPDISLCFQALLVIYLLLTQSAHEGLPLSVETILKIIALFFLFASALGPLVQQVHFSTYQLIENALLLFVLSQLANKKSISILSNLGLSLFVFSCLFEHAYAELFKFIIWILLLINSKEEIYSFPKEKNALERCRWFSLWCFPLGILAKFFAWDYGVHIAHFTFAGSFVLYVVLNLFIGSNEKIKGRIIYAITAAIIFGMLTRVSAIFMTEAYYRHLAYGALVIIGALIGALKIRKA